MRNRSYDQRVAEVTRRRLEALAAELGVPVEGSPTSEPGQGPSVPVSGVGRTGRHARRPVRVYRRVLLWVSDRLPAGPRGRLDLGAAHVGLVALVLAGGLVLTAWLVTRSSSGEAVPSTLPPTVSPPALSTSSDPPGSGPPGGSAGGSAGGTSASPEAARLVVDVVGKVRRPGIAVLPAGSRVVDAIKAAGGSRGGVDLSTLNLARLLVDGEQVVVGQPAGATSVAPPSPAASGSSGSSGAAPTALVNLNTADQAALESLPGVGPVIATAILQWRSDNGAFSSVDELLEVSGIGDATLAEIRPFVTL